MRFNVHYKILVEEGFFLHITNAVYPVNRKINILLQLLIYVM